jgi:CheY-like chemotaxis protein
MNAPTLLVIEDARDQAILVGHAARRAHPGLDVRIARDGLEGIAYLAGLPPFDDRAAHPVADLIILDLLMPEVDGFEVMQWIRRQQNPPRAPVVVLTSSINPDHEPRSIRLGAAGFHRKPEDLDSLGVVVRDIVQTWIGKGDIIAAHIWAAG